MRSLHASKTFEGIVAVDGILDANVGDAFLTALAPLAQKLGPEDTRTPSQRRHDALGDMARIVLESGQLPEYGGERPHIHVLVDVATIDAAVAGALAAPEGAAPTRAEWVDELDLHDIAQLCCDATLSRILTNGAREPLDVGRATRVISPALRRALICATDTVSSRVVAGRTDGATPIT